MELIIYNIDDIFTYSSDLTEYDLSMINIWKSAGHNISIFTSFSYDRVKETISKIGIVENIIVYRGAVLFDIKKRIPLRASFLDPCFINDVIRFTYRNRLKVVPVLDKIFNKNAPKRKKNILDMYLDNIDGLKYVSNFSKISYAGIVQLTFYGDSIDIIRLEKFLAGKNILRHNENHLDILANEISVESYLNTFLSKYEKVYIVDKDSLCCKNGIAFTMNNHKLSLRENTTLGNFIDTIIK